MSCKVIYFFTLVFMSISRLNCWLPVQDDYCLVQDDQQYPFYNKYTPYNSVHSTEKLGELPDGCVAIHFAMISRSGNHFPSSKTIQQINNVVKIIKNILQRNEKSIQFCQEDLNLLITYLNVLDENLALELTSQGSYDMIEMAKRKKQEFPSIMDRPYSPDVFEFVVDDSIDLVESAQAFALGLFNSTDIVIEKSDPELLQHIKKTCFDFQSNKEANQYYNNFLSSDIVAKSVSNINRRLGFRKNEGLTKEQIIILYKACGFDSSQDLSKKSLFCVPFTPHDLQVFDYLEDLSRYYTRFVLNEEIREEIASPMIQNIFTTFDEIVSQDGILPGKPLANFYFPYQGVIHSFMAAIGLIDINNAIGSENYDDDCDNRKFKSSQFDSYSSNVDLILFKCKNGERYRVMIRSQEKPLTHLIEGCEADNGLYCWRAFKNYIQELFKKINVEPITPTPEYTTVNVDEISPPRNKYVLRY